MCFPKLIKLRANHLISQLNDTGVIRCGLAKDCTVRVNNNIVVHCGGYSKIYTVFKVEEGCDDWQGSQELLRSSSLDETIKGIKKYIDIRI